MQLYNIARSVSVVVCGSYSVTHRHPFNNSIARQTSRKERESLLKTKKKKGK